MKVIFIPKAGKSGHSRPISLFSFLLKTLERLVDLKIRGSLYNDLLRKSQLVYLKGRPVEATLHEVVRTIEKSLDYKEHTLAAFNNVESTAIRNRLQALKVE